eukprot:jgi/Botrbrau1/2690/Bobra.0203s0033.1
MAATRGRPLTEQERIDQATLEITNPNVVGSGYIQHPPQRPFEKPVLVQPPTIVVDVPEDTPSFLRPADRRSPPATAGSSLAQQAF